MLKNSKIKSKSVFGTSKSVFGTSKSVFGSIASSSYIIILSVVFIAAVILIANKQQIQEGFFNNKYTAEYYYMEGCHHCDVFNGSGVWEQLINEGGFTKITLKKYDRENNIQRLKSMNISSFPTIIIVDNSGAEPVIIASFEDERSYPKLYNFIKPYDV